MTRDIFLALFSQSEFWLLGGTFKRYSSNQEINNLAVTHRTQLLQSTTACNIAGTTCCPDLMFEIKITACYKLRTIRRRTSLQLPNAWHNLQLPTTRNCFTVTKETDLTDKEAW